MKKTFLFLLTVSGSLLCHAQVMTPDDALQAGLKNNFDVIIAKNAAEADSIMNSPGEAGMLPTVSLNGSFGVNQNSIHQKYANGNEFTANNAGSNSLTSSVSLSWTLFDGTKMFVTKHKLETLQMQGEYEFRSQVLNTSASILTSYYDIVRQKQKLNAIDEVIKANQQRLDITETRFTSGSGPKTDYNQAKIDLNVQLENRLVQAEALSESKRTLNNLLARDVNTSFDVIDSIPEGALPDRQQLEQKMYASNPDLLAFKAQVDVTKFEVREARSQYFPRLGVQAGYSFSQNQNSAGFSLYNQSNGPTAGVTLAFPIYQAGKVKRQVAVSTLDVNSAEMQFARANLEASLQLQNGLSTYDLKAQSIVLEKENVSLARENMQMALDRLNLGQGTAFEVQQAQITLSSSLSRLSDLQYEMKAADISVHRIAADL
ncbi:MAG TPA: TolC family protein [Bacteroidia bacterium]|nr:TolC family protein [Bacteroidia bacterium]